MTRTVRSRVLSGSIGNDNNHVSARAEGVETDFTENTGISKGVLDFSLTEARLCGYPNYFISIPTMLSDCGEGKKLMLYS
jgi:hypothetical protein